MHEKNSNSDQPANSKFIVRLAHIVAKWKRTQFHQNQPKWKNIGIEEQYFNEIASVGYAPYVLVMNCLRAPEPKSDAFAIVAGTVVRLKKKDNNTLESQLCDKH